MKGRVLIAEDDEAIGRLIGLVLLRSGINSDVVNDGRAAVEKLATHEYTVLICDLMMPTMNGYEVIEALRDMPHRPFVIVLTAGLTRSADLDPEVVTMVMRKPFEMDALSEIVRDLADHPEVRLHPSSRVELGPT